MVVGGCNPREEVASGEMGPCPVLEEPGCEERGWENTGAVYDGIGACTGSPCWGVPCTGSPCWGSAWGGTVVWVRPRLLVLVFAESSRDGAPGCVGHTPDEGWESMGIRPGSVGVAGVERDARRSLDRDLCLSSAMIDNCNNWSL